LYQTLEFDKHINDLSDKWLFIESYWNKNENKFKIPITAPQAPAQELTSKQ
jgi:hypothetical protein